MQESYIDTFGANPGSWVYPVNQTSQAGQVNQTDQTDPNPIPKGWQRKIAVPKIHSKGGPVSEINNSIVVDANIAAFLSLKGFILIPFVKSKASEDQSSRVAWDVQADEDAIEKEMRNYYRNEKIGILDYVKILKEKRSEMYAVKAAKGQLKGNNNY
jgi:hypothetical protein